MRRRTRAVSPESALRLFGVFAVVSLVPVLVLGLVLAASYRANASARGLAEAKAQAGLFDRTSVEPRVTGIDLSRSLAPAQVAELDAMATSAVQAGEIVRFRIRSLSADVVYSNDRTRSDDTSDEVLDAAHGETVAEITHLNADDDGDGEIERGIRVAEVYAPITDGHSAAPTGVLELYLPYDPIAKDIDAGLHSLYRDLAVGLLLLYVVLAGISWSVTRRLRRLAARNGHLATYDQLTGLPNRNSFHARLEEALADAAPHGLPTTVAILNLHRFRVVNDTLGHGNGDALLVEVGRRLREAIGENDVLARLGGDDFAIVLAAHDGTSVDDRVRALHDALTPRIDLAGIPVEVEAAVGLAQAPQDGTDAETLLRHADVATDRAKQDEVPVARYDAAVDPYDPGRLALAGELRRAIADDELVLHFQPKLDLRTGRVDTVEALIRWEHPERGMLMPDTFVPVVEQTGLIEPMTGWVLDAALLWVRRARAATPTMRVAVNVSARNLVHEDFADQVIAALARHHCPPDSLAIEVTETALAADPQRAEASLLRLARAGVRISIDDFGCGQTSLSQLASMPVDEVKIDRGFVTDMGEVAAHASIVQSVIDLAHRLGLEVVAEGVEDEAGLELLRRAGCDIAQGYHVSRPVPAGDLERWLAGRDVMPSVTVGPTETPGRHRRETQELSTV